MTKMNRISVCISCIQILSTLFTLARASPLWAGITSVDPWFWSQWNFACFSANYCYARGYSAPWSMQDVFGNRIGSGGGTCYPAVNPFIAPSGLGMAGSGSPFSWSFTGNIGCLGGWDCIRRLGDMLLPPCFPGSLSEPGWYSPAGNFISSVRGSNLPGVFNNSGDIISGGFPAYYPDMIPRRATFIPLELIITFAPKGALNLYNTEDIHRAVLTGCPEGMVFRGYRPLVRSENLGPEQCPIDLVSLQLNDERIIPAAVERYKNNPCVLRVEPDRRPTFDSIPNDPEFSRQWNMYNVGQAIPVIPITLASYFASYPLSLYSPGPPPTLKLPVDILGTPISNADIDTADPLGLHGAWDILALWPFHLREITVAVIDRGIQYDHPDLYPNMKFNPMEAKIDPITGRYIPDGNGKDDDGNGFIDDFCGWDFSKDSINPAGLYAGGEYQIDITGHGTAIAGIIAAEGNNGIGIAGINWEGVKIMPLKIDTLADIIEAIEYAIANRAYIANCSWCLSDDEPLLALEEEIQRAAAAGILFVTGAGNDFGKDIDITPCYPGSYPGLNIICTASTDNLDNLAVFSNYGRNSVDLGAPGQSIYTTWSTAAPYPYDSAQFGIQYAWVTGSSIASAHVAGVAAMVWAAHPSLNYLGVRIAILEGTEPNPNLLGKTVTGGDLNAYRALSY